MRGREEQKMEDGKKKGAGRAWRVALGAGALALAAAGCVPWPHTRVHAPARAGRVVAGDDGTPVAGAVVTSLENGKRCVSGEDGRFELPEAKGWHWGKMVSPPLTYSVWPFLDVGKREQPVRVEAAGFMGYDEENGGTEREVRYRSFGRGRSEDGRWWCPVETQRVEIARSIPVLRNGVHSPEEWNAGAKSVGEMLARGAGADKTVRLVREGAAPAPFSLCFDLEDEAVEGAGRAPAPDGRPPKARVLWWGKDAPVAVLFGECAPGETAWRESEPFWVGSRDFGCVSIALGDDGLPARFSLQLNGMGSGARRRDAIASGETGFRIAAWETFGVEGDGAAVWESLRGRDPRVDIR